MDDQKQSLIKKLIQENVLITKEILERIRNGETYDQITTVTQVDDSQIEKKPVTENKQTLEKSTPGVFNPLESVEVIRSSDKTLDKVSVNHFINHYKARLDAVTTMLRSRSELQGLTSVSRLQSKDAQEEVSIIGYVQDMGETKNGHMRLNIEDKTGTIMCLVVKRDENKELFNIAKNLVFDDIVGIVGNTSDKKNGGNVIIFVNEIILPEIPISNALKKAPDDVNAVFIGDLHVGAKGFLLDEWNDFTNWLRSDAEDAKKVKYIFIVGDIIEGVGIYPNQEHDLAVVDVTDQYDLAAKYLKQIPSDIPIIITPGNHDTARLAEPQPPIPKKYAHSLLDLPNIVSVSSPSYVRFHKTDNFPGFVVLLYHGISFFYYINNVESIRKEGGIDRPELIMEFLLKRRHMAPAHGSTQMVPDPLEDEMLIDIIPDFFITGHIHKSAISKHRGVTLMNCSCFVDVTDYQKKQGMVPDLAKVAVTNLKTREVKIIDFAAEKNKLARREADQKEK